MSTRGTTYWDDDSAPMDWAPESRLCPFDDLPARICGCPEGERLEALRMQHYDGMGSE